MDNELYGDIENDLKSAMRSKNREILGTLRMLIASIKNKKIELGKELDGEEIAGVVKSEIKKRKDSIEAYNAGGRAELAEKEQREIDILGKYMPEQMSDEEVENTAKKVIDEMNASKSDFGTVMGKVMGMAKGKADGAQASKIVKKLLQ